MNYNVRLFNLYGWLPNKSVETEIQSFITSENPSICCFQEYRADAKFSLKNYYKYEFVSGNKVKSGQAIFSKFPIVNSGSVSFPNTANNAIYVDIAKRKDTVRIYNLHLQSSRVSTKVSELQKEGSEELTKRIGNVFQMQQSQAEILLKHKSKSPYKSIISGDFNNTAYSYVYDKIKGEGKDAFKIAGNGFGKTFSFNGIPLRIDFILADKDFTVNGFKNYDLKLSDHYPIKATLR